MKLRYRGLIVGILLFIVFSLIAQTGLIHKTEGIFGYFANSAFLFNFTSLLIPAAIASVLFPSGGIADVIMILVFSIIQFSFVGFLIGKIIEHYSNLNK